MSDKLSSDKIKESAVLALGYFDGVHKGHKNVLSLARKKAENTGAFFVAFSFNGNLRAFFKKDEKVIYTSSERRYLLKKQGVEKILSAPVNKRFLSLNGKEFLMFLSENYKICALVCGKDYVFGSDKCNVEFLKTFAKENNFEVLIAKDIEVDGKKISATHIKDLLKCGKIEEANALLGNPYFITGKVFKDRHIGTKLGFPTVNIKINKEKSPLLFGVYGGHVFIKGKEYRTVINYGSRPTYNLDEKLIEAHIIGYSGDLYGKTLKIFFDFFIRDIMSFNSEEELKEQLKKDVYRVKEKTK